MVLVIGDKCEVSVRTSEIDPFLASSDIDSDRLFLIDHSFLMI